MAVAHSAASESHTGTTGSTNQASFSWTHTQSGTPRGVVVFVHTISASNFITSVTYGGLTLERVAGAVAIDTAGEPGRTDMFFLGSGLGTGNQTITVNRTNNATIMYASAATVTAGANVNVTGIQVLEQNQTLVELAIDDGSSGIDSLRYAAAYYGANSPAPAGANSTQLTSIDLGSFGNSMVVENTAGQGARNVGFQGGADDLAAVFVAVREVTAWNVTGNTGSFTLTGNDATLAVFSPKVLDATAGTFSLSGNAAEFARAYSITIDAGGFTLTGNDTTLRHDHQLTVDAGPFAVTGNDVALSEGGGLNNYNLPVDVGVFALTGGEQTLARTYALAVETGVVVFTGNSITLADTDELTAEAGAFTLTGNPTNFARQYSITIDAGGFTLTGNPADLLHNNRIDGGIGSFSLTGNAATLSIKVPAVLTATTGTFAFTGNNAALADTDELAAEAGAFALTGIDSSLSRTYALTANTGVVLLTGNSATLVATQALQLLPNAGPFVVIGNSASFAQSHETTGGIGEFTVAGQPVTFTRNWALGADRGQFQLAGNTATLSSTQVYVLTAEVCNFALTGKNAALSVAQIFAVTPGTYALTGNSVALADTDELAAQVGSFNAAGHAATFKYFKLSPSAGSFTLTNNAVVITKAYLPLLAADANFDLIGLETGLYAAKALNASGGEHYLTGQDAALDKIRRRNVLVF